MRQQISDGNSWYSILPLRPSPLPSRSHKPFGYKKVSATQKNSPTKLSGPVRQQILDRKSLFSTLFPPSTLRFINFSDSKHSQQHKRKLSRFFSVLWDKKFPTEKSWSPLGYLEPFLIPEFFWNTEKVSYEIFGLVRQKCFDGKSESCLLSVTILDTKNLLKHRRLPLRSSSVLWVTKLLTENCEISRLCIQIFHIRKIWNAEGFLYEVFRLCETTKFRRELVILHPSTPDLPPPPRSHKPFGFPKTSATQKRSPIKNFGPVRQHIFDGKSL